MEQDVFQRNLLVESPKQQDILRESSRYFQDTKYKRFKGDVLGYCTPVSSYVANLGIWSYKMQVDIKMYLY